LKNIDLGFTELEIYDDFMIGRTREGVNIDLNKHNQVIDKLSDEFEGPYGWILDEVNSYSIDFNVLLAAKDDLQIVCCAVVGYRRATRIVYNQAVRLVGKPCRFFESISEAQTWVRQQLSLNAVDSNN